MMPDCEREIFFRNRFWVGNQHDRTGLSLLEVIIATVVLTVSVAMLVRILGSGDRNARRAEQRVLAQLICQNRLNRLLVGDRLPDSDAPQASLYYPGWFTTTRIEEFSGTQRQEPDLVLVEVSAYFVPGNEEPESNNVGIGSPVDLASERPVYSIRRIMRSIRADEIGSLPGRTTEGRR